MSGRGIRDWRTARGAHQAHSANCGLTCLLESLHGKGKSGKEGKGDWGNGCWDNVAMLVGQCGKQFVFGYFVFACNMHTQKADNGQRTTDSGQRAGKRRQLLVDVRWGWSG